MCVEELNCSQEDSQSQNVDNNENPVAGSWERRGKVANVNGLDGISHLLKAFNVSNRIGHFAESFQ